MTQVRRQPPLAGWYQLGLAHSSQHVGLDAASSAELVQAYARGVGRIVAAEAEIARRFVPVEPSSTYEERIRDWLETTTAFGAEAFNSVHAEQLATALSAQPADAATVQEGTVVFVDLCNSTTFMLERSSQDVRALVNELFFVAEAVAVTHDVSVVKYLGDGVVLLAAQPHAAVDAAKRLVMALGERLPLRAAAGVAHGRLLAHAGDYVGPAMNLASRLAELACADEVLVDLERWPGQAPDGGRRDVSPRGLNRGRSVCAISLVVP